MHSTVPKLKNCEFQLHPLYIAKLASHIKPLIFHPLLCLSHSFLMGNQQLNHIHSYAFIGAEGPIVL